MQDLHLGAAEARFADIVWKNAPLTTAALIDLCARELSWKRTTTYTVLKRLCEGGLFRTEDGTVTVLLSREDFCAARSERFVADTFDGSLPAFIAAFTAHKSLSEADIDEIEAMITQMREGK